MGIRINFGTSRKKNTLECINEINAALKADLNCDIILLVPEQFSSYYEEILVEQSIEKGSFRAEVSTFKRLAYRTFTKVLQNSNSYIDNAGKSMLMFEVVSELSEKFEAFSKSGKFPSFANEALKTIREFKRYRVTPEILYKTASKTSTKLLSKKIEEIAAVFALYEEKINKRGFCDADDNLTHLAALINQDYGYKNTLIWIDGFDGFTPTELDVIESLMAKAKNTTFSFCCSKLTLPGNTDVFYPVVKNIIKIQKTAERLGLIIFDRQIKPDPPEISGLPGEIEHLAMHYFEFPGSKYTGSVNNIKLYKAETIYEEVRRCALDISQKVRKGILRYGDICIVSGLYDDYKEYIDAVFESFDIPVFLDEKRSIAKHPVAAYLLTILDIYIKKYSYESICEYIKSPYSDIDNDDMSMLENYLLQWEIKGIGMWTHSDWDFYTKDPDNEYKLQKLNSIRKRITSVLEPFFQKLRYGLEADEFIKTVYEFMLERGIFEKIKSDAREAEAEGLLDYSDELKQSWNILMDIFNQIHIISSKGKQTAEKYRILLELALSQKKIGVIPPRTDAVFAGKINKAYGNRAKMLMLLGANDPGFPEKIASEGLLTDKDRADIITTGLELAPDTKTQVLNSLINTYNLLYIPETYLYVSYSASGVDGSIRQRSNFFNRMEDLFEIVKIEDSSYIEQADYILNPVLGLEAINCLRGNLKMGASHDSVNRWYSENKVPLIAGQPEESIPELEFKDIVASLLGDVIESSPTTIEKYVSCPYKYFAGDALNISPRTEYEISAPDVGSILHGILKDLVSEHIYKEVDDVIEYSKDAEQSLAKMKLGKIFARDKRHGFLGKRLIQRAVDSFIILKQQVRMGEFNPIHLEAAFGRNKPINAPRFSSEGHSIYLNGRIDRVDGAIVGDDEYFRIVDYKSSDRKLSLYKINEGLDIQLAAYLMAYEMHSGTKPAGMYYFTTDKKLINASYQDLPEDIDVKRAKASRMEGYTLKSHEIIKAMDSNSTEGSRVIHVKYNQKKDEYSNKVLSEDTIGAMIKRVGEIVLENTNKIYNCEFPVSPVQTESTACKYCDFNDICGFDSKKPGCEYRNIKKVNDKDVSWSENG